MHADASVKFAAGRGEQNLAAVPSERDKAEAAIPPDAGSNLQQGSSFQPSKGFFISFGGGEDSASFCSGEAGDRMGLTAQQLSTNLIFMGIQRVLSQLKQCSSANDKRFAY
jgi:hypothetical protein